VSGYTRKLDLRNAVHTTSYSKNGAEIREEVFLSSFDDVLVVRISSGKRGSLNGTIRLTRQQDVAVTAKGKQIILKGQIIDIESPEIKGPAGAHLRFSAIVDVRNTDGTCTAKGNTLEVRALQKSCCDLLHSLITP